VLYEMLTGHVPFRSDTPIATMYRHVNEDPPLPSTIVPVQSELEAIVMRCLEKDPKRRFASAAELEAALLAVPLARSGDTMRLETVGAGAAETQPVATVDGGGAPTEPVAAVSGGDGATRPTWTAPSHAREKPRGHGRWLIAALVVALLLALTGVLIAATNDPFRPKAAARAAAREVAENALPPDTPVTFTNAWSGLFSAIGSALATDDISDHAVEELTKRAGELLDAYRDGDPEKLGEALAHLDEELTKAVEDEEISPTAADSIDSAILDLGSALESEGALEVVPTEVATGPTSETSQEHGDEDKGGSPPYGEAQGHDED
jgi:hypothetical protein